MSNTIKAVVALGLFVVVAACGQQNDTPDDTGTTVVVDQPTGKY